MKFEVRLENHHKRFVKFATKSIKSDAVAYFVGCTLIALILYFGLVIALANKGIIPKYDGLSYFANVLLLKEYFFDSAPFKTIQTAHGLLKAPIPFTNAFDVIFAAALWPIVDLHVSVYLVHAGYVLYFYKIFRRVYGEVYALMLISACIGYGLFFSQFSNLISELPVGLGFVAIISLLFVGNPDHNRWNIFITALLLILLRVFNIAFLSAFALVYLIVTYKKKSTSEQLANLTPLLAPILFYFILLPQNIAGFLEYAMKGNENLHVWIAMSGINNKYELATYYLHNIFTLYSRFFPIILVFLSIFSVGLLNASRKENVIKISNLYGFVASVVLMYIAFMQPSVSNINIVYWPYAIFCLVGVVLFRSTNNIASIYVALLFALYATSVLWSGFQNQLIETKANRSISELSHAVAANIKSLQNPILFSNFHGIGAVDPYGLQLALGKTFDYAMRNNLVGRVDSVTEDELHKLLEQSNILLLAKSNYFWPKYIEWNKFIPEVYQSAIRMAPALGYQYLTTHYYDESPEFAFDVWVKPEVKVSPSYSDGWLSEITGVKVISPTRDSLDEFKINLELIFHNPGDNLFVPPIKFELIDHNETVVSAGALENFGKTSLCMNFSSKAGHYKLKADRSFSTPTDARKLVAQLISSSMKKGSCHVN